MSLAYDIVNRILELSADNYGLLYHCSLVNWEFNYAASRLLYFRVVLSPLFRPVLNLRDTGSIPVSGNARYISGNRFPVFIFLVPSSFGLKSSVIHGSILFIYLFRKHPISPQL